MPPRESGKTMYRKLHSGYIGRPMRTGLGTTWLLTPVNIGAGEMNRTPDLLITNDTKIVFASVDYHGYTLYKSTAYGAQRCESSQ